MAIRPFLFVKIITEHPPYRLVEGMFFLYTKMIPG